MNLNYYKIYDNILPPVYSSDYAACFDISSYISYQSIIKAFTKNNSLIEIISTRDGEDKNFIDIPAEWRVLIPTGLIFDIDPEYSVRLYPRSGLSTKKGLNLINCVGIIDSDYVEEVFIPVYNNSQQRLRIYHGDRIAQGELVLNKRAIIKNVIDKPNIKTNRIGGFGSTGV